jgi:DNA-binding CsgD family transcriptional regulator
MFYNKKALRSLTIAHDKRNRNIALLEIGYGYFQKGNLESALYYYKNAEHELIRFEDNIIKTSLDRLIGIAYLQSQNYPSALQYLRASTKTSDSYDYHKYILLSQVFLKTGDIDSTQVYLKKYLQTKQIIPEYYEICSELSLRKGNLIDALRYSRMYLNAKSAEYKHYLNISLVGLEKKLNFEKIETENQKLVIRNQRFTIVIALVAILCLIIAVIILIEQIQKNKLALKHEADIKLINQQKIKLQTERISKITILQNLIQLKLIPKSNLSQIGAQYLKLFDEINYSLPAHTEDIIKNIDSGYDNFSQKLAARIPSLSQREILVCCCLKAGINQESILSMLNIKSETYYHYRSNIRKKMNAGQDDKVEQILSTI